MIAEISLCPAGTEQAETKCELSITSLTALPILGDPALDDWPTEPALFPAALPHKHAEFLKGPQTSKISAGLSMPCSSC